jgi:Predicted dinucleotide-binding enzymes
MTISDSTVAIIGTGTLGSTLAANFAAGGQDFQLAGRDQEATRKLASDLDGHAEVVSVDEAVDRADMLVLAVWFDSFKELIAQYGERLSGKVIVDPTNPTGPDGHGGSARSSASRSPRARSWPACCLPGRVWSRRSARCRPERWPRPRGRSPIVRWSSTPRTTTQQATWSPA